MPSSKILSQGPIRRSSFNYTVDWTLALSLIDSLTTFTIPNPRVKLKQRVAFIKWLVIVWGYIL